MTTSTSARSRGPQPKPPTPRRRRPGIGQRIFRVVLLIFVVGILSVLATLYFVWPDFSPTNFSLGTSQTNEVEAESSTNPVPAAVARPTPQSDLKPIFVDFEPFTVTLTQDGRSRILYVGITLQVSNKDSQTLLHEYQPVVRDRILNTLSMQDPIYVQSPEGRQALIRQLESTLKNPYPPANHGPDIDQVLFTTFVVQ